MTEEQFNRAIEIHNRLEALERVKREIAPAYNSDTKIMVSYIEKRESRYGACAPSTLRLISELLDKHDEMIRQEIDEEIQKLKATEDERVAYEAGYQACCYDHGIPFVRIRRVWKSQVKWEVMLSDVAMERFPIEQIAQDIAREMKDEYEKYKRNENEIPHS